MSRRKRVRSQKQAASALEITDRRLREWEQEAWWDPAFRTSAGYDIEAITAARDAMGRKGSEQSDAQKRLKLATDAERLKQAQYKTRQDELETLEREGELIPRRAVELHYAELLTAIGDWADQLPDLVAAELPKKYRRVARDRVKQELDRRRVQLRNELERRAKELNNTVQKKS